VTARLRIDVLTRGIVNFPEQASARESLLLIALSSRAPLTIGLRCGAAAHPCCPTQGITLHKPYDGWPMVSHRSQPLILCD